MEEQLMKLVRYITTDDSTPRPGVLSDDGDSIRGTNADSLAAVLRSVTEGAGRSALFEGREITRDDATVLAPIESENRLFCLGGVYTGHLEDAGLSMMVDPNQWAIPPNAIVGPEDPIVLPERVAENVKPAAELCIVVGKAGKYIDPMDALDYVAGYTVSNDVTARTDWPGAMAYKMMDTFAPVGPHVTTVDEVMNPGNLDIEMRLDGRIICQGNTSAMRFTLSFMLSYISTITELHPGDIISTGDPGGVQEPLEPNSTVEIEIQDVGTLWNPVVSED